MDVFDYYGNTGVQPHIAPPTDPVQTVATVADVPNVEAPKETHNMQWLSIILGLIPVIAQGIQTIHKDKSLGDKSQLATDSLSLAIAGATATVPASDQPILQAVAPIAQQALSATVATLHNTAAAPAAA